MADRKINEITAVDASSTFDVLGVESGVVKVFNGNTLPIPYAAVTGKPTLGNVAGLTYPGGTTSFLRADGTFAVPAGGSGGTDSFAGLANGTAGQFLSYNKTFQTITKTNVGLDNVDNTSDTNKPVSTAQATAIALKANAASPAFTGTPTGLTKTHVGLANVDNTSDANKPISIAETAALALKANLASPTFTGTPAVPTATPGTNTTQAANTAFVTAAVAAGGGSGGFANPMTAVGDLIIGGTSGAPTRLIRPANPTTVFLRGDGTYATTTGAAASNATQIVVDGIQGPARTQLAKNREVVSVLDFGAIGDGQFSNHPLSDRYGSLGAAQAAYPTVTNLALSDQIDWAAWQAAVDYMQATGKIIDGVGLDYCINKPIVTKTSGFFYIKGSRCEFGGKRMGAPWIGNGTTVADNLTYPTLTNLGPLDGCAFYFYTLPYYAYMEDINLNDFRFGCAFLNDPNSPIFYNINGNYTNCLFMYYQGCQNPRYVNCGGGQLGVLHISSATAFGEDHPSVGNDNYYSDNVTITNEVGYTSIGSNPSSGFDTFFINSILRPTVQSRTAGGTRQYADRDNNLYTDPFYLNPTGRICFMPFRNLRDCFSFTMHADSRGGLRYGYALVGTEIAALELYANNFEQLFEALPDEDTTASLLTCGSVYSGTMQMASQIDYIEKNHPMITYNGRGQSRGYTDHSGITLLGTSIIARKGNRLLGFNNGHLYSTRHKLSIDENTPYRTQGRPDTNAPVDWDWDNENGLVATDHQFSTTIASNPLILKLPFQTADGVKRVHAMIRPRSQFAGYVKATVYNANSLVPVDSAVYYWDSRENESYTLAQAVNNGDTEVVMSSAPAGNYSTTRYAKWSFSGNAALGFLMDGYLAGGRVKPMNPISGLSGTIASGQQVSRSEKLQVVRAFTQNWIRLGISISGADSLPFHSVGYLGVRNNTASSDTTPNTSAALTVILTLHHVYPG